MDISRLQKLIQEGNVGVLVCCRSDSVRLPGKAQFEIAGKSILWHLLNRLKHHGLPNVVICTTQEDRDDWIYTLGVQMGFESYGGAVDAVFMRMLNCAKTFKLDHIVRITADDIFTDFSSMEILLERHLDGGYDFTHSRIIPRGCDFEIMKTSAMIKAMEIASYKYSEHVSYYMNQPCFKILHMNPYLASNRPKYNLSLDYPEDLKLVRTVFNYFERDISNLTMHDLDQLFVWHPWLSMINRRPEVSVYTPYHILAGRRYDWLDKAIRSVREQTFKGIEHIIVNDGADRASLWMGIVYLENPENEGLTISSNKACKWARGKYVLRLDSDDWLEPYAVEVMYQYAEDSQLDAVYPDYWLYDDKTGKTEYGDNRKRSFPHPAGALIKKTAWEEIRYNENIKKMDGIEFWEAMHRKFRCGFLPMPLFYYRQHGENQSGGERA